MKKKGFFMMALFIGVMLVLGGGTAQAQTRDDYKEFIQSKCRFGNADDVWAVMDTHKYADDLYKTWANSYPAIVPKNRPSGTTDEDNKKIIQSFCKFHNQQAVWDAVAKHKFARSLLKVWADSYYGLR